MTATNTKPDTADTADATDTADTEDTSDTTDTKTTSETEQTRIEDRVKRVIHYHPGGIKRSSIVLTLCAHAGEDPEAVNAALDRLKKNKEIGSRKR